MGKGTWHAPDDDSYVNRFLRTWLHQKASDIDFDLFRLMYPRSALYRWSWRCRQLPLIQAPSGYTC